MAIDLPAVRQAHPLASFCHSRGIELKRSGSDGTLVDLCPLHAERTPSFHIYPDEHFHCCSCGAHGDVIALCSKLDGLTVVAAARKLASGERYCRHGVRAEQIIAPASRTASRTGVELERAKATVMRFGKHRGKRLDQVPKSYLQWCLRECSSKSLALREAIRLLLEEGGPR